MKLGSEFCQPVHDAKDAERKGVPFVILKRKLLHEQIWISTWQHDGITSPVVRIHAFFLLVLPLISERTSYVQKMLFVSPIYPCTRHYLRNYYIFRIGLDSEDDNLCS